ncbi:cytochrome P450 3A8-like [Babylonia areolata]|uniref:cytochrome P450 3A8-like n=1 Tax=Babylonia areolata TaxID=304850 RepID=UPI003FD0BD99
MDILGLIDIPLWMFLLLCLTVLVYMYGTWHHSTWTNQGIPGPKPWPLFGNLVELRNKSPYGVFTDWQRKYGRVVGFFDGVMPNLAVTDLDIVREVMVKQFNNFTDRSIVRGLRGKIADQALFFARGTAWKRIRNLMTPTFSASKLKMMSHYVKRCTSLLVNNIETKARAAQDIDIKEVFGAFTMDVITGTAFGLETNSQTQEEEPFVTNCKAVFDRTNFGGWLRLVLYITQAFPFMGPYMSRFLFANRTEFFFNALEKMVDARRQETKSQRQKAVDFLQMLVEVEADPEQITDFAENRDDNRSNRRMTKEEVMAQGFIVLVAGYETTSTTLQYLTYNLALHPHLQEKVFEEIKQHLGDDKPTYESVSQLKYLEATIHETLRLFPPLAMVNRQAQDPTDIKGIHIPAGCGVTIPIYSIMHDPEYFPDPEVFDPSRYAEENMAKIHPVTNELPFGYGPRKCIGMRLAMLEIKMAAAEIFRRFRFVKCADTPETVSLGKGFNLAAPNVVIKVKAEIRSA